MAGGSFFTPAYGGNGTLSVNGQIVPMPMSNAYYPNTASAPFYTGSGQGPATIPLSYTSSSSPTSAIASAAASNPFSFTQSPLVISVAALVIGILGLRYIHWRH